jgi:hypothetical protein
VTSFFPVQIWHGRLHQKGATYPGTWDPALLRFESEEVVETMLAMMPLDRLVKTVKELDAAVREAREKDRTMVNLWVEENLREEVERRIRRMRD